MARVVSDREFISVLDLDAPKRYSHFIKQVVDCSEVWLLRGPNGYVLMQDESAVEHLPIWPNNRYAEACISGEWHDAVPVMLPLEVFLDKWIVGMSRDRKCAAVFPTPTNRGVSVSPARLRDDLSVALDEIE